MWDIPETTTHPHLSHDPLCPRCGHPSHTYLACSETCSCIPPAVPDSLAPAA
jgi:hypothetical protein